MHLSIVGVGRMGEIHLANAVSNDRIHRVSIFDRNKARSQEMTGKYGCLELEDESQLFDEDVDGVLVATSTHGHVDLILRALDRGKPVFCEKPIASNIQEALRLLSNVEGRGTGIQIGFQRRFDPGYLGLKRAMKSGAIGGINSIHSRTLDPSPPSEEYLKTSGGIFWDCAIHDFDSVLWISKSKALRVASLGASLSPGYAEIGDFESVQTSIELESGTVVSVSNTRANGAGYDARLEVYGTSLSMAAGLTSRTPLNEYGTAAEEESTFLGFADRFAEAYRAELQAFVEVMEGSPSACSVESAIGAHVLASACRQSAIERRVVTIAEHMEALGRIRGV